MIALLFEHRGDSGESGSLGRLDPLIEQVRGHVDAVQDVADVVEHTAGNFSHPRLTGGKHQGLMSFLQLGLYS